MKIQFKKSSELLQTPIPVNAIYEMPDNNGIIVHCPICGLDHEYKNDWHIEIPIICENKKCKCRFIIKNNTSIED